MTIQNKRFTIHQVCRVADVSRTQVNQWISRGFFAPEEEYEHGKQRSYSFSDALRLRVFTDLMRLGLSQEIAGIHSQSLHGFKGDQAVLMVWHGPTQLIPVSTRGTAPRKQNKDHCAYDPSQPPVHGKIIKLSQLSEHMSDPHVYVTGAINLDSTIARLEAQLTKIVKEEKQDD